MRHVESNVFRRVLNEHAFVMEMKICLTKEKSSELLITERF